MNMVQKLNDGWVAGKVAVGREIMTIGQNNERRLLGVVVEIERDAKGRARVAVTDKGHRQGLLGKPGNGRRARVWSREPAKVALVVEKHSREGAYGLICSEAIVDHPRHGLILITEGYGGENDISGGAYRWRHGTACNLLPGDTLESLHHGRWNDSLSLHEAIINGADRERGLLDLSGAEVEQIAREAGLSGAGAPRGNRNAQKGEHAADSYIYIRCRRDQKAQVVRDAQARKMDITTHVLDKLGV